MCQAKLKVRRWDKSFCVPAPAQSSAIGYFYVDEYDGRGAYVAGRCFLQAAPAADDLALQRVAATHRLGHAEAATAYLRVEVVSGQPVDVTLGIAGVQIEQGGYASDLILPQPSETGPATRHGPAAPERVERAA